MKIGPVDTEIALLRVKKEEIREGKIYSPVGKFAERAKLIRNCQQLGLMSCCKLELGRGACMLSGFDLPCKYGGDRRDGVTFMPTTVTIAVLTGPDVEQLR